MNTQTKPSLYEALRAIEARRFVERFEFHHTPELGNWFDMAESELGVLATQCLDRRISNKQTLAKEMEAWQSYRNKNNAKADWQFTTKDASIEHERLSLNLTDDGD